VEAEATLRFLHDFGEASHLRCNLAKSSASPVRCDGVDLQQLTNILQCLVQQFPVQYLGLPLSLVRLTKRDLQLHVEKVAENVPT
jgi:hypothetical protein